MTEGKTLTYPGHTAISVQEGRNWQVIPSTQEQREVVRAIQRSKYSVEKICWFCGEKFDYGYVSMHVCGACKIIVKCAVCGVEFELDFTRYSGSDALKVNKALFAGEDVIAFCSRKCRGTAQGEAFSMHHLENAETLKENLKPHYDERTGHWFRGSHDLTEQAADMRAKYDKKAKTDPKFALEHRRKCIVAARRYWDEHPELIYDNAMKNLGFNAMPHLFEKDGQLYFLTKDGNDVPWGEFKKRFSVQEVCIPDGFVTVPTFREQNSDTWAGSGPAFERSLVDMNVGWFVYIKFYIDRIGQLKPIVIGKSGSMLVNTNGTDVNFGESVDDGAARRFLAEEGLQWCKTQIAIRPCNTEEEAYAIESALTVELRLLNS